MKLLAMSTYAAPNCPMTSAPHQERSRYLPSPALLTYRETQVLLRGYRGRLYPIEITYLALERLSTPARLVDEKGLDGRTSVLDHLLRGKRNT